MGKKNKYKVSHKFRDLLKSEGFFDGRFAPKVFLNKKKELNKNYCRNFKKRLDL